MIVFEDLRFATHNAAAQAGFETVHAITLGGWQPDGQRIVWVVTNQALRSRSFLNCIVNVPRTRISHFIVAYHNADVFTLFVRGTFVLPTRIFQPAERRRGSDAEYAPQNMELGSAFGTMACGELASRLEQLGYAVVQQPWDEVLRSMHRDANSGPRPL